MPERGWYRDPADPAQERLWDGAGWTTTTRPAGAGMLPAARPAGAGGQPTDGSGDRRPGWVPGPWPDAAAPRRAVGPLSTGRSRPPVDASVDPNPGLVMAFPPPPVPPADGDGSATARCSRARRAAAGLLDRIVIVGPTAATYLLWQLTARPRAGGGGPDEATVVGLYVLSLLWALVSGFTDLVVVQGITGQSLGKRLLHIRLVRDRDGEPLGVGPALVRWTLSIGFGLLTCGIGAVLDHLWPLWSGDGKRIVDTWRACSVVDAPDGPAPAPPAPPAAPTLP